MGYFKMTKKELAALGIDGKDQVEADILTSNLKNVEESSGKICGKHECGKLKRFLHTQRTAENYTQLLDKGLNAEEAKKIALQRAEEKHR